MEFSISTIEMPRYWVLNVEGELDLQTVSRLKEGMGSIEGSEKDVVIILNRISFIDSAGLAAIVSTYRKLSDRSLSLALVSDSDAVMNILRMTGLDKVIPTFADFKQATDYLLEVEK